MAKDKKQVEEGTFARLYDVQEEMSRRQGGKPMGRPKKTVQRKPTTVYLTSTEKRSLAEIKFVLDEHFSINQSELVGLAINTLHAFMQKQGNEMVEQGSIKNLEQFRKSLLDFVTS